MQLFHKNGRFVFSSLFSNHGRFLQLFSTSTTTTTEAPKLVDYLVKSLGFSNQQAISPSLKVRESKLNRNSYLVVDFFKQSGFDDAHIRKFVSKDPSVLKSDVDKTLKPRIRVLQDLGLSGSDLGDFVADCRPKIFRNISKNNVDLLAPIVGTNENVLKVLKRSHFAFSADIANRNFTVLRNYGVSVERLQRLLARHPEFLCYNPDKLEDICARVCDKLGVSVKSHTFIPMIRVLLVNRAENLELKYEVFKSYGWTESDIGTLIRKKPDCLNSSQVMIRRKLEYFMKELGLEAAYVASRPCLLGFSMEKRLVPRNAVLRVLKERKLECATRNFLSALTLSESRFLSRFVIPYNDQLPGLFKAYRNNQMDSFSTSC